MYLGAIAGALHELERAHYTVAKEDLIRQAQDTLFPRLGDYISSPLISQYLNAYPDVPRDLDREFREYLLEMVSQDNAIFRAQVRGPENELIFEVPSIQQQTEKLRRFNTWENSLFNRHFTDTWISRVRERIPGDENPPYIGSLEISWTTPRWTNPATGHKPVEVLTMRYRLTALLLVAAITAFFAFFAFGYILPLRRVSGAIEYSLRNQPVLLKRPSMQLERAYNDLAREALTNRLRTELNAFIQQNLTIGVSDVYQHFAAAVARLMQLPYAAIEEVRSARGDASPHTVRHVYPPSAGAGAVSSTRALHIVSQPIHAKNAVGEGDILHLGFPGSFFRANPTWCEDTARQMAQAARASVESLRLHQANVFRQRSEASINLAENLGHDLTNIIATAKLDLSTLSQILELDEEQLERMPHYREMLSESVEHLLANAQFLQEIVNIYRAYTYLRRPKYETVQLNDLIENISTLFLRSISSQIRLERQLDPQLGECEVEPRLLKLAFFNLLTNAVEAVKQAQAAGQCTEPVIAVQTQWLAQTREALLVVRDSGLGIRNASGELATPEEASSIFRLGFTTKSDSVGSGLGLSWVRSIIAEFHSGRVEALNSPAGGAEFRLYLRVDGHAPQ